jgi:hypothetical protein
VRGFLSIAVRICERSADRFALDVLQGSALVLARMFGSCHDTREVIEPKSLILGENSSALERVAQLADITWPARARDHLRGAFVDP